MHFFEQSLQCSMSEPISTTSASSTCQCASSDERMLTRSDWAGRIAGCRAQGVALGSLRLLGKAYLGWPAWGLRRRPCLPCASRW